ncbi:sodium/hydrogen exchanger 9B1-like isoform X1 [Rousettus aegyptiacus]|uniref:Solute carrier family 9 member B1 n=1 Tax=Rousettus aegyptiacus TaxID=9407 RepID=A0A7J8EAD4_ROUAE|nr:sodium/hydrogen exchanger 9B1-like isoform X1 [Rousettus aegyptiacus]KAF6432414.1 solute carrier family 9 member B1 [Rousettus aegyptiacus]
MELEKEPSEEANNAETRTLNVQPSERMYTTELLEDKNIRSSVTAQILNYGNTSVHEEIQETFFPKEEEIKPEIEESFCPPKGMLNKFITNGVLLLMVWCVIWSVAGPDSLPGGSLFGLLVIFYSAVIGGKILQFIRIPSVPQLPPLLGMLLAGFTIRNIPFFNERVNISNTWSSTLRNTALTIILIRAGLGLDPQALKQLKNVCLRLSMGPCLMEACSVAVVSHFLLNFPWQWGFLLGFVLGAVSPAVVVPSMLLLQDRGYGIEKGIPTLLIAASSFDDILAITGFNTCLGIVFSSGGTLNNVLTSLRDVFIGVLVGILLGIFVRYFPSKDQRNLPLKRALLVLSLCVSAVLGSQRIGMHGAGGLCTLMTSFIGGKKWSNEKIRVQKIVTTAWNIFQPLLFGLVGLEVSVAALKSDAIGISVAALSLTILIRISFTFLMMCFAGFSFKEKIFIALAWMPKATVQAVLGPLALETARLQAPHLIPYSKDVMTLAFLAILITAPNGALIIGILGPKVLTRHDPSKIKVDLTAIKLHH